MSSMTTLLTLKLLLLLLLQLIQQQYAIAATNATSIVLDSNKLNHNFKLILNKTNGKQEEIKQFNNNDNATPETEKKTFSNGNNNLNQELSMNSLQMRKKRHQSVATTSFSSSTMPFTTSLSTPSLASSSSSSSAHQPFQMESLNHQLISLPLVPLPPPPPFPGNFALTPFSPSSSSSSSSLNDGSNKHPSSSLNAFAFKSITSASSAAVSSHGCGGILKARHGIIQTPNFPHKFSTPIECIWLIDASELHAHSSTGHNTSIVVYLTQLYILGGLKFTEYMYYSDDYKVPAHRVFTLTEDDVTQVAWIQFSSAYLEIRFQMSTLDGTHLRALDRLLDVYGFNITYEVEPHVKPYQCNTLQCRFLGHCYAASDYGSYSCSCFPGFSGMDCGRGPLCEDPHTNICQNGGTCKHIGDAAITCHCPNGYKGTKCEIPEIKEQTMGCTANSSAIDCHRECDFESSRDGISMLKTSRTMARSGKTRYEVTIRLGANLTAFYRHADVDHKVKEQQMPSLLERHCR